MNTFSLDRSSPAQAIQSQMTLPQMAVPLIQQPDQAHFSTSTNLVNSLSESLFPAFLTGVWVAFVFFHLGMRAARRQMRYHDRTAEQRQHIQTLERIWQMSAKRKD